MQKRIWMMGLTSLVLLTLSVAGFAQMAENEIDQKVSALLKKMTLEEKVGQMTQVTIQAVSKTRGSENSKHELDQAKLEEAITKYHVGSLLNVYDAAHSLAYWHEVITRIQDVATQKTRLKIPVIYGIDAIHGANYTREATLFPQSIAMAATRNTGLMKQAAAITAYEVRASGIPWNFNPVLGMGRQPLWPRLWETFGEDPYLTSEMAEAYVKGSEGDDNNVAAKDKVAACMKHYLGYSVPLSGKDRTPAWIPERMLRDIFLPPFKRAVDAGVHTVMVNSTEINGIPTHSDHYLLTEVLRNELGFKGFVVSDWEDVNRLYSRDKVAASRQEAVKMAVMAGVDMSMVPYDFSFYNDLLDLANSGEVPMWRIDEAVGRILRVKYQLGLFENPYPDKSLAANVSSEASVQTSLQAAREAMTLLKNRDNFLPLRKDMKVLVTGPTANLRSVLNGGWTYTWQGNAESLYPKEKLTILEAVQAKVGKSQVTYQPGADFDKVLDLAKTVEAARAADVAVVCIGEATYCETPGNIHDLNISPAQMELALALEKSGTPVVLVLVEGRPRVITPAVEDASAILMAYLPGPEGGRAVADVLFGDYNPGGKLPITYPRSSNDLVCYDYKPVEIDDSNKMNPLWLFGHGLSYTTYTYQNLKLDKKKIGEDETLNVSLTVTNSGKMAGKEVVELYLSDLVRSVSPPVRQLKRFQGVYLKPGESQTVQFTLSSADLTFHGRNNKITLEAGEFMVAVGDLSDTFELVLPQDKAQK